jgi:hypothetical protein
LVVKVPYRLRIVLFNTSELTKGCYNPSLNNY